LSEPRDSVRTYVRSLEETVSRLAGRPVILSQRDWHLATKWHEWGVPIDVVLSALEARRGRGVRNLACVAREVESTWRVVAAGRTVTPAESGEPREDPDDVVTHWRRARDGAPGDSALRALLEEIVTLAETGRHAGASLDRRIDAALPEAAPAEIVEAARAEAEATLSEFRARMSPETFGDTLQRAVVTRLRRALRLPRWSSGSPPSPGETDR
jgi:hypothetical protein